MFRIGISLAVLAAVAGFAHHAWEEHNKKVEAMKLAKQRDLNLRIMPMTRSSKPGPLGPNWYKEKKR